MAKRIIIGDSEVTIPNITLGILTVWDRLSRRLQSCQGLLLRAMRSTVLEFQIVLIALRKRLQNC